MEFTTHALSLASFELLVSEYSCKGKRGAP
jgi:hypothetical protein